MPCDVTHFDNGVDLRYTGVLNDLELRLSHETGQDHHYPEGLRFQIRDFSASRYQDVTVSRVRECAERDRLQAQAQPGGSIVIVAPELVVFGLARMWQTLMDDAPVETSVVRTRSEALTWLAGRGYSIEP